MEMRYFWLISQVIYKYFKFYHHLGAELLPDNPTKARIGPIHTHVSPYHLHMKKLPTGLICVAKPGTWRGCTKIIGDPYTKGIPLPRIPYPCTRQRLPIRACSLATQQVWQECLQCRTDGLDQLPQLFTLTPTAIAHYTLSSILSTSISFV